MKKKSNFQPFYRKGDIAFIPGLQPRGKCKPITDGIVARGEATGHAHKLLVGPGIELFEDEDGIMWIEVSEKAASVVHEEHGTISLPTGTWQVRQQREYTPEKIHKVMD